MTPVQTEAIIWAMLALENEIDQMEIAINPSDQSEIAIFYRQMLQKHKEHFQAFKEMLEG